MSARLVVLPATGDGVKSRVAELPLILTGGLPGVPLLVRRNITRMVFGFDHLGAGHAVIAVCSRGFARGGRGSLAPQVGADRGGEHATPAAQHQGKDNTDI